MQRWTPLPVALAGVVLVLGGCSGDDDPSAATSPSATASTIEPGTPEVAAGEACAEVRAGIDAFNLGDFDETVDRFEAAVPLVEEQADGSAASDQLVEAVRWYAALPAEDYLEASRSSTDFQRYKAITLGQCVEPTLGDPGTEPSEPGLDT